MANPSLHEQFDRTEERTLSHRSAGLGAAGAFLLLACAPLLRGGRLRWWALCVSAVILLASLLRPSLLHPMAWLGRKLADLLGRVVGLVSLALLFYLVVTPFGLARRLFVRDPLRRRIDKRCNSYWVERRPPGPSPESMAHQF
ncbi:MAG TPA: hypothetical protein VN924_08770 [Bryobacteraceae bacterium]|nr:hypothetical protein [Bryobacteraceae bacterium]